MLRYLLTIWNRVKIIINDIFLFSMVDEMMNYNLKTKIVNECRQRDWLKWKEATHAELTSLANRKAFGLVVLMPENVNEGYVHVYS